MKKARVRSETQETQQKGGERGREANKEREREAGLEKWKEG